MLNPGGWLACLAATAFGVCAMAADARPERPRQPRWEVLFDGTSTEKWRGYRREEFPAKGWQVDDGTLRTIANGDVVDLISKDTYDSFDLQLEWKVTPGANSGVMFHVTEEFDEAWQTGPEMQVLDDEGHADGKNPKTSAGALYALMAPTEKVAKPVGGWNRVRLLVRGNRVQHFLNGKKIVEYQLGSRELQELVSQSKFKDFPKFGKTGEGHIVLQHHKDEVWFRDVRIRRIRNRPQQ